MGRMEEKKAKRNEQFEAGVATGKKVGQPKLKRAVVQYPARSELWKMNSGM